MTLTCVFLALVIFAAFILTQARPAVFALRVARFSARQTNLVCTALLSQFPLTSRALLQKSSGNALLKNSTKTETFLCGGYCAIRISCKPWRWLAMLDLDKIGISIRTLGWAKGAFVMCLILLFRHVVKFEECLILILIALAVEILPSKPKRLARRTDSASTKDAIRNAGQDKR
jgi:hypothetical protein